MEVLTGRERAIVQELRERVTKWGRHADIPAPPHELATLVLKLEAAASEAERLAALLAQAETERDELRGELTRANRQLGAAKAREAKLRKQSPEDGHD